MKTFINSNGNEVKIYAKTLEDLAYEQVKGISEFEAYSDSKIRIMPDAHAGKGCVIGTTMTITDKVTPNLVGVDIGCGMLTIKLKESDIDFELIDKVINTKIPSGFNVHNVAQTNFDFSELRCADEVDIDRAMLSLGTLGGGNHFIEVSRGEHDIYLIIHSGSRKLGTETCKYYQNKANGIRSKSDKEIQQKELIERLKAQGRHSEIQNEIRKLHESIPNEKTSELEYLTGNDFDDYMNDMEIVQRFATINRHIMADIIIREAGLNEISRFETIHNYIDFSRKILRKGAVSAEKDEMLLIPINMRDGSLLCVGKGNEDWNYSAPHGAGRLMSRTQARKEIEMGEFTESMKGIFTTSVADTTLDEAPQAYKSMEEIIETITPTAEIVDVLKPIYNYKAH